MLFRSREDPAAFLAKPYQVSNVRVAIELALNNFAVSANPRGDLPASADPLSNPGSTKEPILQMGDCVFVKYNYQFVKVPLADILFVAADSNHINLHTSDKKFVLRLSLSQLFDRLIFDRLIRIHRSFAVNIDAIQSFTEQKVLTGKGELPIGRNYKEDFLKRCDFR